MLCALGRVLDTSPCLCLSTLPSCFWGLLVWDRGPESAPAVGDQFRETAHTLARVGYDAWIASTRKLRRRIVILNIEYELHLLYAISVSA